MVKKLISIAMVLILVFTIFPINIFAEDNDIFVNDDSIINNDNTGIPDKYLYRAVLRELGKSQNEEFTKKEVANITKLDVSNHLNKNKIKTLKGIKYLSGLITLYINWNKISSLAEVESLDNLTFLDASDNLLTDLTPIKNLTKLKYLAVQSNKIVDLEIIRNLTELRSLHIGGNKWTDLTPIRNLTQLNVLAVDDSNLTNLVVVENLTELESLSAEKNKLKVLPNLKNHTKLNPKYTGFRYNNIKVKELETKLPLHLLENSYWLEEEIKFQNVKQMIKITKPKSFKKLNRKTTKIVGKTHKGAIVELYKVLNSRAKRIKKVKANTKGVFTFKKLNLKKLGGKKLILHSSIYSNYHGEKNTFKSVTFKIRKK